MFRCALCHGLVPPRTPAHPVVLATRPRVYPFRAKANRPITRDRKVRYPDDPGGSGREIAREVRACPACARAHEEG